VDITDVNYVMVYPERIESKLFCNNSEFYNLMRVGYAKVVRQSKSELHG
tara:strand:- start:6773 stop:6919 length:147 start_codon:yes stop_codon:yes gene_type:complete